MSNVSMTNTDTDPAGGEYKAAGSRDTISLVTFKMN